jgi:hypothetical protein
MTSPDERRAFSRIGEAASVPLDVAAVIRHHQR